MAHQHKNPRKGYRPKHRQRRKSRASLLSLPTELRLSIYEHVYDGDRVYICTPHRAGMVWELSDDQQQDIADRSILQLLPYFHINRILRDEIMHYFFSRLDIRFVAALPGSHAADFLRLFNHPVGRSVLSTIKSTSVTRLALQETAGHGYHRERMLFTNHHRAETLDLIANLIRESGSKPRVNLYCSRTEVSMESSERRYLDDIFRDFPATGRISFVPDKRSLIAEDANTCRSDLVAWTLFEAKVNADLLRTSTPLQKPEDSEEALVTLLQGLGVTVLPRQKAKWKNGKR